MKKTILTLISSVMIAAAVVSFGFAQASLNSPGSMPTITVGNASTGTCSMGPIDGCWQTSATARPGEQVAVHIYYKNTGNQNSESTTLSIKPRQSGVSSSVTFTGGVASITAPRAVGSATVSFSTPSKVTYIPGSAKWYPTSSSGGQSVNESGLFGTSGFNIGTLAPGKQGVLVANFIVEADNVQPKPQCNDGIDNDGDGLIDYPSDPGCSSLNDNDEYNAPTTPIRDCRINDFTVDGRSSITIERGDSARLSWNTTNCDYVTITSFSGNINPTGNFDVSPSNNTTYTIRAYPNGGTMQVNVNVRDTTNPIRDCRINDFTVDGRSSITIERGDSARLSWNTTNCDYVRVTDISGNLNPNSSGTVRPTSNRTYTLTAYPGGETQTVRVNVSNTSNTGDACDIVSFRTNRSTLDRGQVATISWDVRGADTVDILPGYRNRANSGSVTVSPSSTTTYRIEVSGNRCSDSDSLTISVRDNDSSRPQAITTIAAITSQTSAQLNGIAVPNTQNYSSSVWFEWGSSRNLGYQTGARHISAGNTNVTHGDSVTGLVSNTTYYYRTVVQNQNGTAYGDIVSFRTPAPSNNVGGTTVVTQPTRVIVQTVRDNVTTQSAPSLLELQVGSAYDHMCIGGDMEYVITYRNISSVTLEDAVLRLALPKELNFVGSSKGSYDALDRILTVPVGRMSAGEQGTVTLRAKFNDNSVRGNLAVMTATMVYTNPITKAQEDAIAYSLVTVSDECPMLLGASVFGVGSFLPGSLLEWLLLILVILILVILARNIYKKREEEKKEA